MERWVVDMGHLTLAATGWMACSWDVEVSRYGPVKEAAQVRSTLPSDPRGHVCKSSSIHAGLTYRHLTTRSHQSRRGQSH